MEASAKQAVWPDEDYKHGLSTLSDPGSAGTPQLPWALTQQAWWLSIIYQLAQLQRCLSPVSISFTAWLRRGRSVLRQGPGQMWTTSTARVSALSQTLAVLVLLSWPGS